MLPFEGTRTIETPDLIVTFYETERKRDEVFEKLLEFYTKHKAFCGESIMQLDGPQVEAPELLSQIADILGFEVKTREEVEDEVS